MTDEQYNRLVYLRGKHHTVCHHPCGSDCTAFKKGKCIALTNTLFRYNKPCPFFKDKTEMTEEELHAYKMLIKSIDTGGENRYKYIK